MADVLYLASLAMAGDPGRKSPTTRTVVDLARSRTLTVGKQRQIHEYVA
jgi:hypothetical protein